MVVVVSGQAPFALTGRKPPSNRRHDPSRVFAFLSPEGGFEAENHHFDERSRRSGVSDNLSDLPDASLQERPKGVRLGREVVVEGPLRYAEADTDLRLAQVAAVSEE